MAYCFLPFPEGADLLSSISVPHCLKEAKGGLEKTNGGVFVNTLDPRPAFFANPVPLFLEEGLRG